MKEEEFKINDIVVVIDDVPGNYASLTTIGKIVNIDKNNNTKFFLSFDGYTSWCKNVRKATSVEVLAFNNGVFKTIYIKDPVLTEPQFLYF